MSQVRFGSIQRLHWDDDPATMPEEPPPRKTRKSLFTAIGAESDMNKRESVHLCADLSNHVTLQFDEEMRQRTRQRYLTYTHDNHPWLIQLVDNTKFEMVMAIPIIFNSVTIGIEANCGTE